MVAEVAVEAAEAEAEAEVEVEVEVVLAEVAEVMEAAEVDLHLQAGAAVI